MYTVHLPQMRFILSSGELCKDSSIGDDVTNEVVTLAGELKCVPLKEFIQDVNVEKIGEIITEYNIQTKHPTPWAEDDGSEPATADSVYKRRVSVIQEISNDVLLKNILDGCSLYVHAGDGDILESVVVASVENFGQPTHFVQLTENLYACLCAEDFKYKMKSPLEGALICYAPNRNFLFKKRE